MTPTVDIGKTYSDRHPRMRRAQAKAPEISSAKCCQMASKSLIAIGGGDQFEPDTFPPVCRSRKSLAC